MNSFKLEIDAPISCSVDCTSQRVPCLLELPVVLFLVHLQRNALLLSKEELYDQLPM